MNANLYGVEKIIVTTPKKLPGTDPLNNNGFWVHDIVINYEDGQKLRISNFSTNPVPIELGKTFYIGEIANE